MRSSWTVLSWACLLLALGPTHFTAGDESMDEPVSGLSEVPSVKDIARSAYETGKAELSSIRIPGSRGSGRRSSRRPSRGSYGDWTSSWLGDKTIDEHVEGLSSLVSSFDANKHYEEVRGHVDVVSQAAMKKAEKHTLPHVTKFGNESKETVHYVVRKYVPAGQVALALQVLSWTLVIVPLLVAVCCLYAMVATSFVTKCLLFCNLYLTVYCVLLAAATFVVQHEPMAMLQQYSEDSYVSILLIQACFYFLYLAAHFFSVFSLRRVTACSRLAYSWQLVIGIVVGLHYYFMLWHPSMMDLPTSMDWVFYSFYAVAFGAMGALSRAAMMDKTRTERYFDYFDEELLVDKSIRRGKD